MTSSPEEIEAEIGAKREQLAETVDALTAKLDVKAQASARVDQAKATTQARVDQAKATTQAKVVEVKDRATTVDGKPRPELVGAAVAVAALVAAVLYWRHR